MTYTRVFTGPKPKLVMPKGACDSHIHFYSDSYTALPNTPTPPAVGVAEYRQVMDWLGIERVIVVQANAYGDDNRLAMDCTAELGLERARAVVVVKPGVNDAELERLTKGGARGLRTMNLYGGMLRLDVAEQMANRIAPFGWSILLQLNGRELPEHEAMIRRLPCKVIIDHVGKFIDPVPVDHPSFQCLLRLVDTGNVWVKLAGVYETSKAGKPRYEDVGALASALVRHAPERMIWASNFPHAQADKFGYPDEAKLLDLMLEWAPNEADRRRIFVDNPAEIYGF
ncbi:amidohydrolase family protein [Ferrovibrio sp. MS7]|uniref:amidohydrolase family protein n=1 Tax=Ferrovibrio plantarum TaxID=3119164 RepID=UPI003134ECF0